MTPGHTGQNWSTPARRLSRWQLLCQKVVTVVRGGGFSPPWRLCPRGAVVPGWRAQAGFGHAVRDGLQGAQLPGLVLAAAAASRQKAWPRARSGFCGDGVVKGSVWSPGTVAVAALAEKQQQGAGSPEVPVTGSERVLQAAARVQRVVAARTPVRRERECCSPAVPGWKGNEANAGALFRGETAQIEARENF